MMSGDLVMIFLARLFPKRVKTSPRNSWRVRGAGGLGLAREILFGDASESILSIVQVTIRSGPDTGIQRGQSHTPGMPHATNMPYAGFQAFILCGPGLSLNTFTSNVADYPKALVPIANRPMVWYALDWCYRMGVTNITLVTPPESAAPLESALAQNPHLTGLPVPRPELLCPKSLTQTTGTAEIFRTPEVQKAIISDFIVLPCDLICDLEGSALLQSWMVLEAGLGGATGGMVDGQPVPMTMGGEKSGRRGGLAVWYPTKGLEGVSQKGDETDLVATTPLPRPAVPAPEGHLGPHVEKLVLSIPTSTVKDITEEQKSFPLRHALLRQHGKIKIKTSHRDAHIYFLPFWVKDMIKENEEFDSLSEDVIGWWAKAGWQQGLAEKLNLQSLERCPLYARCRRFDDGKQHAARRRGRLGCYEHNINGPTYTIILQTFARHFRIACAWKPSNR
jgi:hypothetical protein